MLKIAVIIPVYKENLTTYEKISLSQCFSILGDYQIIIVCPKALEKGSLHQAKKEDATFVFLEDSNFKSLISYNHMMLSIWFYRLFNDYEYILIHQLDCFIFKDELSFWVNKQYSYIGAPWLDLKNDNKLNLPRVGNGGLSLRNVKDTIRVLKSNHKTRFLKDYILMNRLSGKPFYWFRGVKHFFMSNSFRTIHTNSLVNEDKVFAFAGKRFGFFKIPKTEEAIKFAFEMQPKKTYQLNNNELPFGCHAWWKHDLEFMKPFIEKFGYKLEDVND